ncbi:MAG: lipoyl synthase [Deltaproteobacteria bacterium]|nr:lipoyl synthase [Deltaproteobacteria bacterium]MBW2071395.1 lipoyl synthase [Deltaproteobacteria bacterium]
MDTHKPKARPAWLRKRLAPSSTATRVKNLLSDLELTTVCQQALCPNQIECFSKGTATFMILGSRCSRNCTFCAVETSPQGPPAADEPLRVAEAVCRLGLRYVVVTSVARDDLADGGASHFAATMQAIRCTSPGVSIELLVPDFGGSHSALRTVLQAPPAVLNHNVETISRLYPAVRPQANYGRSLQLLTTAKKLSPETFTKSGFMVGLGETAGEIRTLLSHIRHTGCDLVTIGQYLPPSPRHHPVVEYVAPERFEEYVSYARALGFIGAVAGPYVRSSYEAAELYQQARLLSTAT